ncbi:glycosyltransferase family 4 protein [Methanosarcina sp.]|uniref:glycosyltransferase family 4 protein n=1 Tax=Methanosarcina sp. TaxID=2213 RepID=UPI003C75E606
MRDGAPSNVGRNIFDNLYTKQKHLPFEEVIIYTDSEHRNNLKEKFKDIEVFTIKETFRIGKEDVIHIPVSPFVFPNAKFILHSFAKLKNNRLILNYHGDLRNEVDLRYKSERKVGLTNIPTYLLIPSLLNSANRVVVNSDSLKNRIISQYGTRSIEVIPNAVESYWFSENQEKVNRAEDKCEIFYHGRLSPEKGVELLIKGLHEFLSEKKNPVRITLYIAGEGSQKEYLQHLSKALKVDNNIIFLGNIDRKEIKEYLMKVDGAIYPSIWDNFPLSIIEALASANCPVFFSRNIGIYDFVTEKDLLNTFDPNVRNVADIFHYIFENKINRKVIQSQKKFAEKYTWDKVINHYIKLYRDIIGD